MRAREQAHKEREREKARKEKERARALKEKEREKAHREKERARELKEKEREKARKEKERARELKEKEREKARKEKERARALKEKEREKARKEKERALLAAQRARLREAARKAKEQERAREKAERERRREEARKAKEEERRKRQEERERLREEARRAKEEERAKREAEREAYRKAKEAERERLRAEREAARRALEGKVARATRQAQRAGGFGARGATSRMYRPSAIPNQSGTTRRVEADLDDRLAEARLADHGGVPSDLAAAMDQDGVSEYGASPMETQEALVETAPHDDRTVTGGDGAMTPTPPDSASGSGAPSGTAVDAAPQPAGATVEARYASILERLQHTEDKFRRDYRESFDMSWIYHDSALEGVVYTFPELQTAIDPNITVVPDSSLQPVCEEIRRHKAAIDLIRDLAEKKRTAISVDIIKKIYLTLHPEEGDLKSVKYRKDIPQHRLYFHEYAQPDKIAHKVRQIVDWLNGNEPRKIRHPVRVAGRVHFDLLRVFPFPSDSGKVARLLMNLLLLRSDYPPAIIHSTERQRYYEALRGSLPTVVQMINESIQNGLQSIEKKLDEQETRKRSFGS